MTLRQKFLLLLANILAAILFVWPLAILMIWGFAEINGDVPTRREQEEQG